MTAHRFRDAALAAAQHGWPVFPLHPHSKTPAINSWDQWATTDTAQIHRWWVGNSRHNIGIATGRAGLVVIDLDDGRGHQPPQEWSHARHGRDVLAELAATAGERFPTGTYTVTTPSGGIHLYFQAPADVELRNTVARLGWHIDTRAAGGYVVAAGSCHPKGLYSAVDERAAVLPLPRWLVTALTPPASKPEPDAFRIATDHHPAYLRAALDGEAAKVATAADGARRMTLLRAAGALASLGELDDAAITATLTAAAAECRRRTSEPFPEREVERTIGDGIKFGRAHPRLPDTG